tara:strand:- start:835 stop:1464 length:630 start_codon:yes stop_codon:yes gene_type:complete
MNKIVVYSHNFGNYRYTNGMLENIKCITGFDYIFYTENTQIKSDKWNIVYVNLKENYEFIQDIRNTSKYYKFVGDSLLDKYETLIHVDHDNLTALENITEKNILNLPSNINFKKHPRHTLWVQELDATINLAKVENYYEGRVFCLKYRNLIENSKIIPIESNIFIYKNKKNVRNFLRQIYYQLLTNKLKRDQNVIPLVIELNRLPISYL